jgi:hypothetical protein
LEIKFQSLPFQQNIGFIGENTELVKSNQHWISSNWQVVICFDDGESYN